ncbi:Hypothetical_protein [Hexamita inflata]|uniref:Hypothetical_protein n=1 Tax=Hexamita inflata TaxID=28002 RepID=A0AA86QUM2_9EUKA|nr:Hypothetical protein HINF_LOCUS47603 [Hexamita inflata]
MKPVERLVEVRSNTDVQIVCQSCVKGRKTHRTSKQLVTFEISLRIAAVIQLRQVEIMIGGKWPPGMPQLSNFEQSGSRVFRKEPPRWSMHCQWAPLGKPDGQGGFSLKWRYGAQQGRMRKNDVC